MKEFWEKKYKPTSNSPPTAKPPLPANNKNMNTFFEWLNNDTDKAIQDKYKRYCALPQIPGIKQGYKWWLKPTQQETFPYLSKMALNILLIPAMLADPEHLFSGARITISDCCNCLGIATIQAIECLKSWMHTVEIQLEELEDKDKYKDTGGGNGDSEGGVDS